VSLVINDEIITGTLLRWEPRAELELDRPAPLPLPPRALLRYMLPEGVLHHRGALSVGKAPSTRWLGFRPLGSPQLLLARRRLRAEMSVPVSVRREDGSTLEATTANLGESGLLLEERTGLQVGEQVRLRIQLDVFAHSISALATIVRVTDEGRAAAHYTDLSPHARERLGWRIFDHLLAMRRSQRV
jgi:hypothetical protein